MHLRDMRHNDEIVINQSDLAEPIERLANGHLVYVAACRAKFQWSISGMHRVEGPQGEQRREPEPEQRVVELPEDGSVGGIIIEGTASSSSIDWYGTRMGLEALEMMKSQFSSTKGVAYIPRHGSMFESMEWDNVIGRTVESDIRRSPVADPRDELEDQYLLDVRIRLFDEPLSRALVRRIDRGEIIGQSIGGWFTRVRIVTDEDGDVIDIVVLAVELDHLAVTRSPANPDADRLRLAMRTVIGAALSMNRSTDLDDETSEPVTHEHEHDTKEQIQPMCSLSAHEADGTVTLSFNADAEEADIRSAYAQLLNGDHGSGIQRALEAVHRSEPEEPDVDPTEDGAEVETTEEPEVGASTEPVDDATDGGDDANPTSEPETSGEVPGQPNETEGDEADTAGDPGNTQETQMDETMLAAIRAAVAEGIAKGMALAAPQPQTGGDNTAGAAPTEARTEPTPAPAPEPAPAQPQPGEQFSMAEQLKIVMARAERAEERVTAMATAPARIAVHERAVRATQRGGHAAVGAWETMASRAREEGAIALPTIIERATEQLSDRSLATSRSFNLEHLLSEGLNAAEADGLLVPPSQYTTWGA